MTPSPCPFCGNAASSSAGGPCPNCGQTIPAVDLGPRLTLDLDDDEAVGPPVRGLPPPPRPLAPVLLSTSQEPGAGFPMLDRCPGCRARIGPKDVRCPACGLDLDPELPARGTAGARRPMRRDYEPHRGPLLTTLSRASLLLSFPSCLGLVSVFFALPGLLALGLGVVAILWAREDIAQIDRGEMDPEGRPPAESAQRFGAAGAAIAATGLVFFVLGSLARLLEDGL